MSLIHYLLCLSHVEWSKKANFLHQLWVPNSLSKIGPEKILPKHTIGSSDALLEAPSVIFGTRMGSPFGDKIL